MTTELQNAHLAALSAPAGCALPSPYYEDEYVTLYNGDAREIVPLLGRFDLMLTDPPYGISDKMQGGTWGKAYDGEYRGWDGVSSAHHETRS